MDFPHSQSQVEAPAWHCDSKPIHITCEKPRYPGFSTAPWSKPTHWQQCVLHLSSSNVQQLNSGDNVRGVLTVKRRSDNQRNLDVTLIFHVEKTQKGIPTTAIEALSDAKSIYSQCYVLN